MTPLPEGWGLFPWDETMLRCPWTLFTPEVSVCVRWWREWRELKVLPFAGDLLDQPAYVMDAIEICEDEWTTASSEATRKMREEVDRLGKSG